MPQIRHIMSIAFGCVFIVHVFTFTYMRVLFAGYCSNRLEGVLDQRLCIHLRHMTLGAEIATRRYIRQHVLVTILEMRLADLGRAGFLVVLPAVTGQAFVGFQVDLVTFDLVRYQRRLLHIVTRNRLTVLGILFLLGRLVILRQVSRDHAGIRRPRLTPAVECPPHPETPMPVIVV